MRAGALSGIYVSPHTRVVFLREFLRLAERANIKSDAQLYQVIKAAHYAAVQTTGLSVSLPLIPIEVDDQQNKLAFFLEQEKEQSRLKILALEREEQRLEAEFPLAGITGSPTASTVQAIIWRLGTTVDHNQAEQAAHDLGKVACLMNKTLSQKYKEWLTRDIHRISQLIADLREDDGTLARSAFDEDEEDDADEMEQPGFVDDFDRDEEMEFEE